MARKKTLKKSFKTLNFDAGNWFKGGGFTISGPTAWYYNGSNYYLGYERYTETYPSRMWIVKQTDTNIETNFVNNGTAYPDNQDHTTPLWGGVKNGFLYVMQCDGWAKPIRVYKSPAAETITGDWTYVGSFDTNASYIWQVQGDDINDMYFVTRTGNGATVYSMALLNVDLDDPASYTKLEITYSNFATNQVRHYVQAAYFTGTSTYRCLFVNHTNESPVITFKNSIILWEYGTNNVHNFNLTTSKDVGTNGGLTTAELEADYIYKGTDSDKTVWNTVSTAYQINDSVYVVQVPPVAAVIEKFTVGSLTPVATLALQYSSNYTLINRGDKFLLFEVNAYQNLMRVSSVEYDLTGLTVLKTFQNLPVDASTGMPFNFSELTGKFLVMGNAVSGDDGNVPAVLINEL